MYEFVNVIKIIKPKLTNIEPNVAQPKKNNAASIPPLEFEEVYIAPKTKININS